MQQSNLPMKTNSNLISFSNIKSTLKRAGRITASSLSTLLFSGLTIGSLYSIPILTIPAILGTIYSGQKLLNQTQFKSYKDLAFIVEKHGNKRKILQDTFTHPDLLIKLRGLSEPQKAGFMQLQTLAGLSKFDHYDKKGQKITYETNTHSIMKKTFETLAKLGYIENYQANFLKTSSTAMIAPRLALGNFKKAFTDRKGEDFYRIQFQASNKLLDIHDPELRKAFPLVFNSKHGILSKTAFGLEENINGDLTITYNRDKIPSKNSNTKLHSPIQNSETSISREPSLEDEESKFHRSLRSKTPTYKEQYDFSSTQVAKSIKKDSSDTQNLEKEDFTK